MKIKEWLKLFLAGMGIGVASSVPGVSGGTVAVIFKVYDKMISAVSDIFKHFVKSFLTLLPILLGVIVAVIPCIFLLDFAFEGLLFAIICLFAGLIIGSFQSITDEVKGQKIKPIHIVIGVITFLVAVFIGVGSILFKDSIDVSAMFDSPKWWFFIVLLVVGILASTALIVPGISGSMLLLVLGFYTPLLDKASYAMKHIGGEGFWLIMLELGAFAIGVVIGFFTIAKLMHHLLKKYRSQTYYGIIGFIVGSLIALFVNNGTFEYFANWSAGTYVLLPMVWEIILAIVLLIGGFNLSFWIIRYNKKKEKRVDGVAN